MKKIGLIFLFVTAIGSVVFSQTNEDKTHYEVEKWGTKIDKQFLIKLLSVVDLESIRLIDKRRDVEFFDGTVISLFSSQELKEKYQRQIPPANKYSSSSDELLLIKIDTKSDRPIITQK